MWTGGVGVGACGQAEWVGGEVGGGVGVVVVRLGSDQVGDELRTGSAGGNVSLRSRSVDNSNWPAGSVTTMMTRSLAAFATPSRNWPDGSGSSLNKRTGPSLASTNSPRQHRSSNTLSCAAGSQPSGGCCERENHRHPPLNQRARSALCTSARRAASPPAASSYPNCVPHDGQIASDNESSDQGGSSSRS